MQENMFCYQCQETARCQGCTVSGVCGKKPDVAAMQDLLVYVTKGLSAVTTALRGQGVAVDHAVNHQITYNLFVTITNANFDKASIQADIQALGLCPSEIIWVPDRDTAYTYAEMGRGVVVGTEMSRMAQARNLASFPMQAHEVLLAVWRKGERNPLVEQYARQVCQTYQAGTL